MREFPAREIEKVLAIAVKLPGYQNRFREAGLCDRSDRIIPDWQTVFHKLRPLEKEELRQNPHLFLADSSDIVYRGISGGTSGKSLVYFAGEAWNNARIKAREKTLSWWGITEDVPILNIASRLFPVRWVDGSLLGNIDREFIDLFLKLLQDKFKVIRGYPSQLCELAAYLRPLNIPPIEAIICTGECLFEYQVSLLKSVFNAPIINEYGCQETAISGLTCPEIGSLHLDEERCFYETIAGELVTTDLFNYTMPLIRYKCGDILVLNPDRCACDRIGLTAKIKGRVENKVRTLAGHKHEGEIDLPPLEGILTYQIRRQQDRQVEFLLRPHHSDRFSLESLKTWTDNIFGEIEAKIYIKSSDILEKNYRFCSDREWIETISNLSWYKWLNSLQFPSGEAKHAANLLYQLINPRLILYAGIASSTQELIDFILHSPPCKDEEIEKITARILLFSCSFLAQDPQVYIIYQKAAERLKKVIDREKNSQDSAWLDLLIPSLYLECEFARSLWQNSPLALNCDRLILDRFNIQNLLYSFEPAWRLINQKQSKIAKNIRPILSVLIGDLDFFSSRFSLALLAYWRYLVHGVETIEIESKQNRDRFFVAWLQWRKAMIENSPQLEQYFNAFKITAKTKSEKARIYLEQGYHYLLMQEQFKIREWLPILHKYAGLKNHYQPDSTIDTAPWIPILRSLAQPLLDVGQLDLAYQCLLLSALPSPHQSVFDRTSQEINEKQSVICDLG